MPPPIGRDALIARAEALIGGPSRLLSVVGLGGIGKTTVLRALHANARQRGMDAVFVTLAGARGGADLGRTVALALELPVDEHTVDASAVVARTLSDTGIRLLFLDDVEDALPEATQVVARWLALVPALHIVVGSRVPLDLTEEQLLEVGPLSRADARDLYAARAERVAPGGTGATDDATGTLVDLLEGIPLAIELAARWARLMPPDVLLGHLRDDLGLLRHGAADAQSRHASLASVVAWSWSRLDPEGQRAIAILSTVRGSFALQTAEALLDGLGTAPAEILLGLRSLALLQPDGERPGRLRIPEPVRWFAEGRLEALGLREDALARHARHHADRARDPLALPTDLSEILRAHDWALAHDPALAVALAVRIAPVHRLVGGLAEAADRLGRTLAIAPEDPARGTLHVHRASVAALQGRFIDADGDLRAALGLADRLDDTGLHAHALHVTAALAAVRGRWPDAERLLDRVIAIRQARGEVDEAVYARADQARLRAYRGDHEGAGAAVLRAVDTAHRRGDRGAEARYRMAHGELCLDAGQEEHALRRLGEARALEEAMGNRLRVGTCARLMGVAAQLAGRLDEARGHFREALDVLASSGAGLPRLLAYEAWTALEIDAGDLGAADALARSARADRPPDAMAGFAGWQVALDALSGRLDEAREALEGAQARVEPDAHPSEFHALRLLQALCDVVAAEQAAVTGDTAPLAPAIDRRRRTLADAPTRAAALDSRVRIARRVVERVCERAGGAHRVEGAASSVIEIGPQTSWMQVDDQPRVDLEGRRTVRPLLEALIRAARERPGTPVASHDLVEAVWAGERMLPHAAAKRLQFAVSSLRKLGLGDLLRTRDGGYLLDPRARVRYAAAPDG